MGSLSDGDKRRAEDIAKAIKASVKGRRALNDNDFDKALRHFKDAVAIEPYNAEYHEWLGTVFHYMEHYADAFAERGEAVRLEPGSARYHEQRGATLHANWLPHSPASGRTYERSRYHYEGTSIS